MAWTTCLIVSLSELQWTPAGPQTTSNTDMKYFAFFSAVSPSFYLTHSLSLPFNLSLPLFHTHSSFKHTHTPTCTHKHILYTYAQHTHTTNLGLDISLVTEHYDDTDETTTVRSGTGREKEVFVSLLFALCLVLAPAGLVVGYGAVLVALQTHMASIVWWRERGRERKIKGSETEGERKGRERAARHKAERKGREREREMVQERRFRIQGKVQQVRIQIAYPSIQCTTEKREKKGRRE